MTRFYEETKGTTLQDEGINLIYFFNIFLRNRLLISSVALFSIIFSSFYAILSKKVWEGQFEIVIDQGVMNGSGSNLLSNTNISFLSQFGSLTSGNTSLTTELEILKSPSVLMPVFDFVKGEKIKSQKSFKNLPFDSWRKNNLKIELKERTSVLKFSYKDKDKNLVIPALSKVTQTYQEYSGRSRKKELILAEKYLKNQIQEYKKNSSLSFKKAQEFAIEQDLMLNNLNRIQNFQSSPSNDSENSFNLTGSIIGIEEIRIKYVNKIRQINEKLEKINGFYDGTQELQYIGTQIPGLVSTGLFNQLNDLEREILFLKSRYTEKDLMLKSALERRVALIKLIKENVIGYLKADRLETEALLESISRPKDVLIKYRELIRDASRDEKTLIDLENNLTMIKLENARSQQPWELITKPTLIPTPVAPNKRNIILIYTLIGLLGAYIYSFIKEKKSGLIYEKEILEDILKVNILDTYKISRKELKINSIKIFQEEILDLGQTSNIKIIKSSAIKEEDLKSALDIIFASKNQYEVIESFRKIENEKILLMIDMASAKFNEVENLKNRLKINNKNLFGILLLE